MYKGYSSRITFNFISKVNKMKQNLQGVQKKDLMKKNLDICNDDKEINSKNMLSKFFFQFNIWDFKYFSRKRSSL